VSSLRGGLKLQQRVDKVDHAALQSAVGHSEDAARAGVVDPVVLGGRRISGGVGGHAGVDELGEVTSYDLTHLEIGEVSSGGKVTVGRCV
jgi:hypothetical protein